MRRKTVKQHIKFYEASNPLAKFPSLALHAQFPEKFHFPSNKSWIGSGSRGIHVHTFRINGNSSSKIDFATGLLNMYKIF